MLHIVSTVMLILLLIFMFSCSHLHAINVTGRVFADTNSNGAYDTGEPGLRDVSVSDGNDVVKTSTGGIYNLSISTTGRIFVYVTKPDGYRALKWYYSLNISSDDETGVDFALIPSTPSGSRFWFVHFTDTHTGFDKTFAGDGFKYRFMGIIQDKFNNIYPKPEFLVNTGDCVDLPLQSHFDSYLEAVSYSSFTIHNTRGNHDGSQSGVTNMKIYNEILGPECYSFEYGNWHFIVYDNIFYTNPNQKTWFEKDVQNAGNKQIITFAHDSACWTDLWDKYRNIRALFHGHWHDNNVTVYDSDSYGDRVVIRTASLITPWSEGNGYRVVTIDSNTFNTEYFEVFPSSYQVPPAILLATDTVDFGDIGQGLKETVPFTIINMGGMFLEGTITSTETWITVDKNSFSIKAEGGWGLLPVNITADNSILNRSSGTYSGKLNVTSNGGNKEVFVKFKAVRKPVISVNKTSLNFDNIKTGEIKTLEFAITNTGEDLLSGTITSNRDWIQTNVNSFAGDNMISVTVNNAALKEKSGQHDGRISIDSNGGMTGVDVVFTATCVLVKPNPVRINSMSSSGMPVLRAGTRGSNPLITFYGDGIVTGQTTIKIYTLSGELSATLSAGEISPFTKNCEVAWTPSNLSPGIYIYTYESPKEKGINKFTVVP